MFGLTPFERNELWNPFREFENEFFQGLGSVSHCRTDIKDPELSGTDLPNWTEDNSLMDFLTGL